MRNERSAIGFYIYIYYNHTDIEYIRWRIVRFNVIIQRDNMNIKSSSIPDNYKHKSSHDRLLHDVKVLLNGNH